MAVKLELSLLGTVAITQNGELVGGQISAKSQALLCYLAVTGCPHRREKLAGLLWGDKSEASAEAKGVALKTELHAELPLCRVDSARLTQVLQNLLANALRHTPAGGAVTVRTGSDATSVALSIEDTGEGIPPEHLPYVFDRFYRTDPARSRDRGGAGLGLAIARAIAEAHAGQITVASEGVPGRGSTFTILLPGLNAADEEI